MHDEKVTTRLAVFVETLTPGVFRAYVLSYKHINWGKQTCLHEYLRLRYNGSLDKAIAMINHPKIDLSIRDEYGRTALDIAREQGLDDIAALIESKIAVTSQN